MKESLFTRIYQHPSIKSDDIQLLQRAHHERELNKGTVFLEAGQPSSSYCLIQSGLFRAYAIDYEGTEVTTQFFTSDEILIEPVSLFQGELSRESLVALEDAVVWEIHREDFQQLFQTVEGFWEWGRAWMSNQLFAARQHAIDIRTRSATDRYLDLMNNRPQILQRAPLKHVASYLGVTDTSLSRIRKELQER